MVAGLLLRKSVCFDRWKTRMLLAHCLVVSWQRRCGRGLANSNINAQKLYDLLVMWAIQQWQNLGHTSIWPSIPESDLRVAEACGQSRQTFDGFSNRETIFLAPVYIDNNGRPEAA